jgi:hypothetical protein
VFPATDCIRISQELAQAFGVETFTVLEEGEYPACAVSLGGTHLLLVRHFGSSFAISLPTDTGFSFRNAADFKNALPEIIRATDEYRKKNPGAVTMADAATCLKPAILTLAASWRCDFPGTQVPSEAWLKSDRYEIGLFQEGAAVKIFAWVGSEPETFYAGSPKNLNDLGAWILPQLRAQAQRAVEIAAEEKAAAAIVPPTLAEAMAALQQGKRIQLGAGRWYKTFFLSGKQLRCEIFDEGNYDEFDATPEELSDSLKTNAQQAWEQLQ